MIPCFHSPSFPFQASFLNPYKQHPSHHRTSLPTRKRHRLPHLSTTNSVPLFSSSSSSSPPPTPSCCNTDSDASPVGVAAPVFVPVRNSKVRLDHGSLDPLVFPGGYLPELNNLRSEMALGLATPWKQAIQAAVHVYQQIMMAETMCCLPELSVQLRLVAVYVRGSTAKNNPIDYISDLDTFAYVEVMPPQNHKEATFNVDVSVSELKRKFQKYCRDQKIYQELKDRFPFVTRFELDVFVLPQQITTTLADGHCQDIPAAASVTDIPRHGPNSHSRSNSHSHSTVSAVPMQRQQSQQHHHHHHHPQDLVPNAHVAKTQARCVWGIDLNPYIPARKPFPYLCLRFAADVARVRHVLLSTGGTVAHRNGDSGSTAVVWICKRILRCGMELVTTRAMGYSRELVPCFLATVQFYPEKSQDLQNVLELACGTQLQISVDEFDLLLHRFEGWIEDECIKYLFGEQIDKDLIKPEVTDPSFGAETAPLSTKQRNMNPGDMLRNWLADSVANVNLRRSKAIPFRELTYISDPLPVISLRPTRHIRSYPHDGSMEPFKNMAQLLYRLQRLGATDLSDKTRSVVSTSPTTHLNEPVVFRGGAKHWPAIHKWSLEYLSRQYGRRLVDVRVSPSNIFTFCKASHPWYTQGLCEPPSVLLKIPFDEFHARLGKDHKLPPLRYSMSGSQERLYLQTEALDSLIAQDVYTWNSSCTSELCSSLRPEPCSGFDTAQVERIWYSTAGAVSPLHYDAAHSLLCQVRGRKRMIFFPDHLVDALYCYPFGHPLHRRSRVNLVDLNTQYGYDGSLNGDHVWARRFPRFEADAKDSAMEVVLEEGDVVFFPAFWAHYTESLALSCSLTYRFV